MTQPHDIRRHANGSIDTGFYVAQGHRIRSHAALKITRRLTGGLPKLLSFGPADLPFNRDV